MMTLGRTRQSTTLLLIAKNALPASCPPQTAMAVRPASRGSSQIPRSTNAKTARLGAMRPLLSPANASSAAQDFTPRFLVQPRRAQHVTRAQCLAPTRLTAGEFFVKLLGISCLTRDVAACAAQGNTATQVLRCV